MKNNVIFGPIVALIIMYKEISNVLYIFFQKTLLFFNASNEITSLFFLEYMSSILILLLLVYILFGFGNKILSPIITIGALMYNNIKNWSNKDVNTENRIAIFLLSLLTFIGVLYFIKDIFYLYSNKDYRDILGIVFSMISIGIFFYISYLFSINLHYHTNNFFKNKEGFWLIGLYSFFYVSLLGIFYSYIDYIEMLLRNSINYILNIF